MTARHIDATDKTDGSHVVKILWNENDGERELTVRMPAAGTDATDRVDVDLLPVPEEDPATTSAWKAGRRRASWRRSTDGSMIRASRPTRSRER